MTSGSFDAVQKVPLGTLTPGSTGLPGAGLDPRCGVGDAIAIAAMRVRAVMMEAERMMVEGGGWKWKWEGADVMGVMRLPESLLCVKKIDDEDSSCGDDALRSG